MGGYGSGRSGGRPTVERGLTLNLYRLLRLKAIVPGESLSGSIIWTYTSTGERVASVGYEAWLTADSGRFACTTRRRLMAETSEPRITGSRWRQRRNRSEGGAGGFNAREPEISPAALPADRRLHVRFAPWASAWLFLSARNAARPLSVAGLCAAGENRRQGRDRRLHP